MSSMPLDTNLVIAVKDGTVELTANLEDAHRDVHEEFQQALTDVINEHQYTAMTDPAILNPQNVGVATCVVSRDPIPDVLRGALTSIGFEPVATEGGGRETRSIFSGLTRGRRARLDKWITPYLRASDISERLEAFEDTLIDEVPQGDFAEIEDAAARALVEAARTHFRLMLTPDLGSLGELERTLLQERNKKSGRWVLHPKAVQALTCFVTLTIKQNMPESRWSEDDESAFLIGGGRVRWVESDPEFRVTKFVMRGNREMLTTYVESVMAQSRGASS